MECTICGRTPEDGVSLLAMNAPGEDRDWRCTAHMDTSKIDPEVLELVELLESDGDGS